MVGDRSEPAATVVSLSTGFVQPLDRALGALPVHLGTGAQMVASHIEHGRWGEDVAAAWYERNGYTVVARNWRCRAGEIDLIVRRGRLVVICEVKARRTAAFGPAAGAVGPVKQQRLRRLAATWLAASGVCGVEVRFDVVAINGRTLEVIPHAF